MADRSGEQLGNYQLTRLLGEGGFAQVYLGEHIHLGTEAAIKVLHTQLTNDDVDQFRNEARTIARLKHNHIVRVLDFGVESKTPFLVMDYAPNGTLRQLHPKGTILPIASVVSYAKQVASALQYAHDHKLIHRDIKPENMLVESNNDILLSDFGIALVAQSSRYQNTQDVIGTVAYMSPEQIQGKPRPASDQYSLAIVIYEWLSGTRPFHGSFIELCTQHAVAPPPSLREKAPNISSDIEQIINTALAKDPHHRFQSIQAFANALGQATQDGVATYVITPSITRPSVPLAPTVVTPPALPPTVVASQPGKVSRNRGLLLFTYNGHSSPVNALAWSPDGRRIASADKGGSIQLWDAKTGQSISKNQLGGTYISVTAIAWSPDGKHLASASSGLTVNIWDILSGQRIFIYRGHAKSVNAITWLSDGRHIATNSDDMTVHVWDSTNGNQIRVYRGYTRVMKPVAWSPDVQYIAWIQRNNQMIQIWDANAEKHLYSFQGHSGEVLAVTWSPNGTWIASSSNDGTVQVWNASTGKNAYTYREHTVPPTNVIAWSPNSTCIASADHARGGLPKTVHIWDAQNGANVYIYQGHSSSIDALAWSPDNTRIASAEGKSVKSGYPIQVWQAV